MEKLLLDWKTKPVFKKRILRHFIMWLVVYIIYNIDLITAWAGMGPALSGLTVVACVVSVYLTLPYVKHNIFDRLEDHNFSLSNKLLLRFTGRLFFYALIGSILSFMVSLLHCLPWHGWTWKLFYENLYSNSSLFQTSLKSYASEEIRKIHFNPEYFKLDVRVFLNIETADQAIKEIDLISDSSKAIALFFSFIRNFPEAVTTTAVFTLWDAMIAIEKQGKKIEKLQLMKDMLGQQDWIHALMNTFFDQTAHLEEYAKKLPLDARQNLDKIIEVQNAVGKLQRYRHSLIKDNDELVSLKYEVNAMLWMQGIVKERNTNICFEDDIEKQINNDIKIVPGTLMELIWNSYKYSKFIDSSIVSDITVELSLIENQIKFYIKNPIGDLNLKNNTTQSGLKTLRKRLDLEYGTNYSFTNRTIKTEANQANYYEVRLIIPQK